jgi:hypothetical protein
MPTYNHDMFHCAQHACVKKNKCYRYWLHKYFKKSGLIIADYYHPELPIMDGCEHFLDKKDY